MDHHGRRVRRVGVLLVATLAVLSFCGSARQTVELQRAGASPGRGMATSTCPNSYPWRLRTTSIVPGEVLYLGDLTACTNSSESATYLANAGTGVWTVSLPRDAGFDIDGESLGDSLSLGRRLFRQAMQRPGAPVLLLPAGALTVEAIPRDVGFTLDTSLTTTWLVFESLMTEVVKLGPEEVAALAQRGSLRAASVVTCGLAIYNFTQRHLPDMLASEDPIGLLRTAMSTGSEAEECARSWQLANEAAHQRRIATWSETVSSLTDNRPFRSQSDDLFSSLKTLPRRFVVQVCALINRFC